MKTLEEALPGLLLLASIAISYFIPAIVAFKRRHRSRTPILILNAFLGWTFVGWVLFLAWSFSSDVEPAEAALPSAPAEETKRTFETPEDRIPQAWREKMKAKDP